MYKDRCAIEDFFDVTKNELGNDATYLKSDLQVMGYNFIMFLALRI